jgi:serine protease Do
MVEEKLPAVVGILSTAEAPARQRNRPRLPPGLEDFFGLPTPPGGNQPGNENGTAPRKMRAQGSGFIISPDGYVVTNNHVVAEAEEIDVVMNDERQMTAELVGTDPATDIALLKIDGLEEELPAVDWGDSDAVKIGEWLVAIGNPFGLGGTVTAGILSARSRNIQAGPYDDFLQTDAPINRGNSGGPLFDAGGNVIGVNTAIFSPSGGSVGIGFAVPSNVVKNVVAQLREKGRVERGWLGVQIQPVTPGIAEAMQLGTDSGALVADVSPDSPAEAAGMQPGDVVVGLNGEEITNPRDLSFAVAEIEAGTEAEVTVMRDGSEETLTVEIGQKPAPRTAQQAPAPDDTPKLGLSLAPLDPSVRESLGLDADIAGVAIAGVQNGSPAAQAGLRRGDVIVEANGTAVAAPQDLIEVVAAAHEAREPVLLRIYRDGNYAFRAVTFAENGD